MPSLKVILWPKGLCFLEEVGRGRQRGRKVREGSGRSGAAAEVAGLGEAGEGRSVEMPRKASRC